MCCSATFRRALPSSRSLIPSPTQPYSAALGFSLRHAPLAPPIIPWALLSSPSLTLRHHRCYATLQSLFVALEEGTPDAMEGVHPKYKQPLPAGLEAQLQADVRLRRVVLLPVLHEFITTQLIEGSWPTDANLKQYLTFTDPDLDDAEWYVNAFPENLTLSHAVALHVALTSSDDAGGGGGGAT